MSSSGDTAARPPCRRVEGGRIDEVAAERPPGVQRLFSQAQTALAADWLLRLDGLELLGPVAARLRFLELSVRVELDPMEAQRRLEASVRGRGLEIDPEQETKTRIVLQHFAAAAGPR